MKKYAINIFWSLEDDSYIAISPEFPRLSAFGDTPEEAMAEMQVSLELAVETYQKNGWALPALRVQNEYSGQFRLRLPKYLHAKLANQAEAEGVSLNTLAITYLSEALGQRTPLSQNDHARKPARDLLRITNYELS